MQGAASNPTTNPGAPNERVQASDTGMAVPASEQQPVEQMSTDKPEFQPSGGAAGSKSLAAPANSTA